ncbi:hypothetical protein LCGC14_0879470 [marine sediment metagenome]|uniref:Uncharacterized protein n=1 Tax=marine sediment metagenome TaxID=412755 RepID=A0A0F9P2C0_9ZZZZ
MPLHDKKLEVSDLKTKISEYDTFWKGQRGIDSLQLDIIVLTNRLDTVAPGGEAFQSGIGGIIHREQSSLFTGDPSVVLNAPEDEPDLLDFVNNKGEPWVNGAIARSQEPGRVFSRKAPDMLAIGRAWSFFSTVPGRWATKEITNLIKLMEQETDEAELKRMKREIAGMRRDKWPFRFRYVDPATCFSMFDGDERLPLVIEHKRMTADEVRIQYDEKFTGTGDIEIYPYANHFETFIYIAGEEPSIINRFEHGLEMSPYSLMEAKLLPSNEKDWRWGGLLFPAMNLIPGFDQLLTDYMKYVHDYTYSPIGVFHDPEQYDDDARTEQGRPKSLTLTPGNQYDFWTTEKVEPLFNPQMNDQQYLILQELKGFIYTNLISSTARGDPKSGTSNNQFVTALQTVRQQAEPYMQAIEDDYRNIAIQHFRGVVALNKGYEGDPDPVEIISGLKGKNFIGMKPKDTIGIEPMIQAVMSRRTLTDQQINANLAETMVRLGFAREQVIEDILGYPQPDRVIERGWQSQTDQALYEDDLAAIRAVSGQQFAAMNPAEEAELGELMDDASPGVQEAVKGLFQNTPGPELQARSNERRTGSFQQPQRNPV